MSKENTPADQLILDGKRIDQRGRSLRTAMICGTVLAGLWIVCGTIERVSYQPPWLSFSSLILGAGLPSLALWTGWRWLKKTVSRLAGQKNQVEKSVDARRESSTLNPDGTSDDD